jgi:hypothetical protein
LGSLAAFGEVGLDMAGEAAADPFNPMLRISENKAAGTRRVKPGRCFSPKIMTSILMR